MCGPKAGHPIGAEQQRAPACCGSFEQLMMHAASRIYSAFLLLNFRELFRSP